MTKYAMNRYVLAYSDQPLAPGNLWAAWHPALALLIPLAVITFVYLWGIRSVWQRAGAGHGVSIRCCICFLGAILALLVALVSPLDALSGALFSAHMIQHLLLILMVAPLLVMSDLSMALLWALPRRWARGLGYLLNHALPVSRAWRMIARPVPAWLLFTITLWVWHSSTLFEAALRDERIHALEHLGFLMTALLFWWVVLKPTRMYAVHYAMAIPYLFTTTLQSGIFGALMTFSAQPWYPIYAARVTPWGFTPLQDQQLAGLIMWLPGGVVFTLLTIGYFAAWFRSIEDARKVAANPPHPPAPER